jgi:hypothetical protein
MCIQGIILMKYYFPDDFIVSTAKGYLEYDFGKRTLLTARTRAAKTTATCFFLAAKKVEEPDALCITFGPNMTNFISDIKEKFEYFEQFQELDVCAVSYNSEEREEFMAELGGMSSNRNVLCVNSDHKHLEKIIPYITRIKNRNIYIVIDEAHKGGEKTYLRTLREFQLPNIAVIETTATFRNRLLTRIPPDFISVLTPRNTYCKPTQASLVPFCDNDYVYKYDKLHQEQVTLIQEEVNKTESLTLINGYDKTAMHRAFKRQLKLCIARADVVIITLNGGISWWTTADQSDVENQLFHHNRKSVRAASSAIAAVYTLGYRHIIVIGHKQVAEGQTIGCAKLSLSLQIRGTPNSKPNADSLAQSIRTGGLNIYSQQRIQCDPQKWADYCTYIEANEELVTLFQDKSPQEQQKIAEQAYINLPSIKVPHGDYQPVRKPLDSDEIGSYYFERPIGDFAPCFENFNRENTAPLWKYARDQIRKQDWYTGQALGGKKANGVPSDRMQGRGNDIQVYVNADPQGQQAVVRPVVIWRRDDKLCVRFIYLHTPCKTHNYFGKLESFSKVKDIILELV